MILILPGPDFHSDVHEFFIVFGFIMVESTLHNYDVYQPRNPSDKTGLGNLARYIIRAWFER